MVSLAKESTSYQLLPSSSTHEIMCMTSVFANLIWEYFCAEPNVKNSVAISPLSARTCFFNKYFAISNIDCIILFPNL